MHLRMKLGAVAVASAASLALTLAPAMASIQASATGPEVVHGALHGKAAWIQGGKANPKVPVKLRGLVRTRGVVGVGPSKSRNHAIRTRAGKFSLRVIKEHDSQRVLNPRICRLQDKISFTFTMNTRKSTGAFAGATGRGAGTIVFAFNYPRRPNGKCNYSNSAVPSRRDGLIAFRLVVPRLTVR